MSSSTPGQCPRCGATVPSTSKHCPRCSALLRRAAERPRIAATQLEPGATPGRAKSSRRHWVIGADPSCDIVVARPTVSRRHCRLTVNPSGFILEDLRSSNGTFVNGQRLTTPVVVSKRDTVTLGQSIPMPWPETAMIDAIRIGRDPGNHVVLDYPVVSAFHAQITTEQGEVWIEDLGSTNGTATGSPDHKIQRARLSPADIVYFGSLRVPASRLLGGDLRLGNAPQIAVRITEQFVIGRDADCDHVLNDPQVSRRHARLARAGDEVSLEDLGSTNGTFVNGKRVRGTVRLNPDDVIGIASFTFAVSADGDLEQHNCRGNVTVEARQIVVEVPKKRLLDEVALAVYPSEFVGLMGPSGAGKTTLMNALNGYTPPSEGSVVFNGRDLYSNYGQFRGVLGYVPQDDIMHAELTVGQALYYTARLRLPRDFSDAEIHQRIQAVISQLGLEGTKDVLIGSPQKKGISGGQRKRVNLAMELLTDPSVLFLDEPTSGLSSEDALVVMKLLRKLADEGKTIVLTIHQPSLEVYRLLDNLIVVGKDPGADQPGQLVYYGPAYPQAVEFFNPEGTCDAGPDAALSPDDVLRGLSKKSTSEWSARYAASRFKRDFVDERLGKPSGAVDGATASGVRRGVGMAQWWTLVRRCVNIKTRDTTNTAILMAQAPIIAVLVGFVFGKQAAEEVTPENWASVANATSITVFLLALAALWFGCSNSAREIVGEWAIYHRERMVTLKIPSYVGSKFTVLGALCFFQCAVLLGIVHWAAGLKCPWIGTFLVLLLTSLVGVAIGLTVSAMARTSEVAIALLPVILLPMVILAGVLQPVHKMNSPMTALAQIMPSRWAFEGLLLLEIEDRPTWTPPETPVPTAPLTEAQVDGVAGGRDAGAWLTDTAETAAELSEQPQGAGSSGKASSEDAREPRDMAEKFFPRKTERMGTRAAVIALTAMLVGLAASIHVILQARDVH